MGVEEFFEAVEGQEDDAVQQVLKAEVLREFGYLDRAEDAYMHALDMDPYNARIRVRYGTLLLETGRVEAARKELARAVEDEPKNPLARQYLALALADMGEYETAASLIREAIAISPPNAELFYHYARIMETMNRPDDAITAYVTAIDTDHDFQKAHYDLGLLYARTGHISLAEQELREAVMLGPMDMAAAHCYGMLLETLGTHDEVEKSLRDMAASEPSCPTAHYRHGLILERLGRFDMALERYATAVRLDPEYMDACVALMALYRRMGRPEEAGPAFMSLCPDKDEDRCMEAFHMSGSPEALLNAYYYMFFDASAGAAAA